MNSFNSRKIFLLSVIRTVLAIFALSSFTLPANAAEPVPGDSCGTLGEAVYTGGTGEAPYFLVCNGTTYVSFMSFGNDGRSLFQVNADATNCTANIRGRLRYNANILEMCTGTCWLKWGQNSCDIDPDTFNFIDQTGVPLNTQRTSNTVQITGITGLVNVSLSGAGNPEFMICADSGCGTVIRGWGITPTQIENSQWVRLRLTSSTSNEVTHSATLVVGSGSDIWNVTTIHDSAPDSFSFTDQTGVPINQLRTHAPGVQVTGISAITPIATSISGGGGEYRVCSDAACTSNPAWTSGASSILNGQYIQVRMTSSASYDTLKTTTVTVGSGGDAWNVTTQNDDDPVAFSFTDLPPATRAQLSTATQSNIVQITGITGSVSISISGGGGQYRICDDAACAGGGDTAFTAASGTITNNAYVQLLMTSSGSYDTAVNTTLTVGLKNDTWTVTTVISTTFAINGPFTYTGGVITPTITPNPGGATFNSGGTTSATNAGTYVATATATGNYSGTNNSLSWTINKASQSISISPTTPTLTAGQSQNFTTSGTCGSGTYSWAGTSGASGGGSSKNVTFPNVGTYTVTVYCVGDANHTDSTVQTATVTVNPIATTFSVNGPFTYNGGSQSVTITPNPGGATFNSGGTTSATNAGTYVATATATGNYSGTNNSLSWTINKANQSVGISPSSQTVNIGNSINFSVTGSCPTGSYSWSGSGGTSGASGGGSSKNVTFNSAGGQSVSVTCNGDGNYNAAGPASASITVNNPSCSFDGTSVPEGSSVTAYANSCPDDTASRTCSGGVMSPDGVHTRAHDHCPAGPLNFSTSGSNLIGGWVYSNILQVSSITIGVGPNIYNAAGISVEIGHCGSDPSCSSPYWSSGLAGFYNGDYIRIRAWPTANTTYGITGGVGYQSWSWNLTASDGSCMFDGQYIPNGGTSTAWSFNFVWEYQGSVSGCSSVAYNNNWYPCNWSSCNDPVYSSYNCWTNESYWDGNEVICDYEYYSCNSNYCAPQAITCTNGSVNNTWPYVYSSCPNF